MDNLNYFMRERQLPKEMRVTLRDFFSSARKVHQTTDDAYLLNKMSPLLQGTVAVAASKRWLDQVRSLASSRPVASSTALQSAAAHRPISHVPLASGYVRRHGS